MQHPNPEHDADLALVPSAAAPALSSGLPQPRVLIGLICIAGLMLAAAISLYNIGPRGWWGFQPRSRTQNCTGAPCPNVRIALPPLPGREPLPPAPAPQVAPDTARSLNAGTPFFKGELAVARPFRFAGSEEDRSRATQCLAAAQLYEAGMDEGDQKAVAQVVLNRVRHPAFPHTVCGVVFEGSERVTGCQFTFTCDGSLTRRYSDIAWDRARKLAARMIDGEVDKRVGWSTHYHTDWVYPYWSPSLDKLAAVDTHLFFKWRGFWGTGAAFAAGYNGQEPLIARLRGGAADSLGTPVVLDPATVTGDGEIRPMLQPLADVPLPAGIAAGALAGNSLKIVHPDGGGYGLLLRSGATADELMGVALRLCFDQSVCRVLAWRSAADMPRGFPIPAAAQAKVSFSYVRTPDSAVPQYRFDCDVFPKAKKSQCIGQ